MEEEGVGETVRRKRGRPVKEDNVVIKSKPKSAKKQRSESKGNDANSSSNSSSAALKGESSHDLQRATDISSITEGIRTKRYRKVAFLVGAGISCSAGIPDFRSPKSGLYARVKSMGLPHPEDIFTLDCFVDDPRAFYLVAKEFFSQSTALPTAAHHFMRNFESKKLLHMVYTQNIDGLEVDVGISEKKLVQAHGHLRSAHCIRCKKDASIESFFASAAQDTILYCESCANPVETSALVKPRIIFFGEKLPRSFHQRMEKLCEADLVFVMGTSLKVRPFSTLLQSVPSHVPIVVINRDLPAQLDDSGNNSTNNASNRGKNGASKNVSKQQKGKADINAGLQEPSDDSRHVIFLAGDIEDTVLELMSNLGWSQDPPPEKSAVGASKQS